MDLMMGRATQQLGQAGQSRMQLPAINLPQADNSLAAVFLDLHRLEPIYSFRESWSPPEQNKAPLIEEFSALAVRCNLPEAFVTALNQAIIAMSSPPA